MNSLKLRESVERKLKKLSKKDNQELIAIEKKVKQILNNSHRFKPLKKLLQNLRRIHIHKSFIIIYSIEEKTKTVIIEVYEHHDKIYKN